MLILGFFVCVLLFYFRCLFLVYDVYMIYIYVYVYFIFLLNKVNYQ